MTVNLKDREYRSFTEFRTLDNKSDGHWVEGYAATFNSPTVLYSYEGIDYKEQIARGALITTDMSDVILNYDHAGKVMARTRNQTLQLSIDSKGLLIRARLDGTEEGRRLFEEVSGGYLDKMSFAFTVDEDEYDRSIHMRTIKRIKKIYDVSIVSIPAYNDTSVSVRSAQSYFEGKSLISREDIAIEQLRKSLFLKTLN